ncbi:MAG: competence/damage-inducible protein A [Halobacteriaceae archaeon]
MRVAVVTVGDELLAGDVTNTNAAWLGTRLTERGATVERMLTVPDEEAAIAETVAAYSDEYDAVVVTGGLGPTHDDRTMAGVTAAFDRPLVEHPDAVAYFDDHDSYSRDDLTEGTTHLPEGARMLPNDEGVAPGAVVENVYVLPGVPEEMRAMFESVEGEFGGEVRHVEVIEADAPESALVERLRRVEEEFGVTVGSYPGERVRIKLQHTDPGTVRDAREWLAARL